MVSTRYPQLATRPRIILVIRLIYNIVRDLLLCFIPSHLRAEPKCLKDENVLITGAASGIGQLTAIRFLRRGARVVLWDVNHDGMQQTIAMAEREGLPAGKMMHAYPVDLTNRSDIYRTAELVLKEIGTIDILVNNAGLVSGNLFLDIPDDRMEATFKVNVFAHFYTIKAFLPAMIAKRRGHLVTIASGAGHVPLIQLSDYCASKFACLGLESTLRLELAQANLDDEIAMTVVKPYLINTGMFSGARGSLYPALEPDQVAQKIVDAVRYGQEEVFLPSFTSMLVIMAMFMSRRCYALFYELCGGFDFMAKFTGRQEQQQHENLVENVLEMNTIKEESIQVDEKVDSVEDNHADDADLNIPVVENGDSLIEKTSNATADLDEKAVEENENGQHAPSRKYSNGSKRRRGSKPRNKLNGHENGHTDDA